MLTRKRRALCSSHRTAREELAVLEIPAVAKQETQRREITVEIQVEPLAALVEIPVEPEEAQAAQEATEEGQAVLAVIPVIAALILGFSPVEVMDFIADGIKTTTSNGILFIFSVIYFGVLADTGLFDVIVGGLVKKAGNNVIAVTVVTALIATIAHLDGTTAVTVLITIPAMYPVYKKMNIDSRILLCLTGACMGVKNLLPWGGPTARAATLLAMEPTELWHMLIPLQVVGLMMNIILAVLLGMFAIRHGAGAGKGVEVESDEKAKKEAADLRKSNAYLIFNFLLTVGVIALLSTGIGKSYENNMLRL